MRNLVLLHPGSGTMPGSGRVSGMAGNGFWRWYDLGARADFGGTLLGFVFDWKGWISAAIGTGGGAMTFLKAAFDGRSPLDVWVLAVVVTAALIVAVYFGISILGTIRKPSVPVAGNEKTSLPSLVDAESIRLAGIVGALMEATLSWSFKLPLPADDIWIKRFSELKDSAHPIWTDDRVRRLRIEFLHYCGIVGKPLGDAHETIGDRKMFDRFGRQLISLLKGEQLAEEGDDIIVPSLDRITCTELLKIAAASGWDFISPSSVHLVDLQDAMRQGGADNTLTIWGRANKWTSEELMRNELLERIPPDHWKEFFVNLLCAPQGDNFHTKSWKPEKNTARLGYVDLYVDRSQATSWLHRDASSFKGRRP